jgi:hypothetical protein
VNTHFGDYLFTTEGHLLPIGDQLRSKPWADDPLTSPLFQEEDSLFFRDKTPKLKLNNGTQPSVKTTYFFLTIVDRLASFVLTSIS